MAQLHGLRRKARRIASIGILLPLVLSLMLPVTTRPALADPGKLMWTYVSTPSQARNILAPSSEISVLAIGGNGRTFYAVDIPNGRIFKSPNGGIGWEVELSGYMTTDGASMPAWNIAVAPDDVNFLVAVTDGDGTGGPPNGGPRRVFVSEDGGSSWENTNISFVGAEYISCVAISMRYGSDRDIVIGTRTGAGTGRVFAMTRPGFVGWADQNLPPSDVAALEFSPTYASDSNLVVISTTAADTRLHLGTRDTGANTTAWNTVGGYPVLINDSNYAGISPVVAQVITADLELPSDFSGQTPSLRRYYVSLDAIGVNLQTGIYRIDDTVAHWIRPPVTVPTNGRISTISYYGTYAEGTLLAGEVEAAPATAMVYVWRASDLTASTPAWQKSDTDKSPTGGGQVTPVPAGNFANAQVFWSPDGVRAYCGTSSANPTTGGTGVAPGQWPFAWRTVAALDESAFSVSPYPFTYEQLLSRAGESKDTNVGNIWNQISFIDTQISSFSDVAALEVPGAKEGEAATAEDYDLLYLASLNTAIVPPPNFNFDSIWRSTDDPLGTTWERILCIPTSNNGIILRVKQTSYEENVRSRAIVFADRGTDLVGTSYNEGQAWHVSNLTVVTDLALAKTDLMYILNNTAVHRWEWMGTNWMRTHDVDTYLDSGHTIAVPLKNPTRGEETEDWVIVGESGTPGMGKIAYADFSELIVEFEPPPERRAQTLIIGDVHVIADDRFDQNKIIYAGIRDVITGATGKIYRWAVDESAGWDELEPPNNGFYGLAQRNDVLYGAWNTPGPPIPPNPVNNPPGVDRTLFSRVSVPPPPEWDDLTAGLPVPGDANFPVAFTLEPSSLKISSNDYNSLWAIDNNAYNYGARIGCLWSYTDSVAVLGPWTTTPPSGDYVPIDPVTGRALEVNFGWRQLSYTSVYELHLAKDRDFTIRVLVSDNITPVDQLSPECYFAAGGLVPVPASGIANWGSLESNHTYYWRVRARASTTGDLIRSPWSATMYFTVMAGLPVRPKQQALTLLMPPLGAKKVSRSPGFSWSPMPDTTQYEFVLAKDAGLTEVVVKSTVATTAYNYSDELDWNATYFWQVRAIEPVISDPSSIGTFTVVAQEEPAVAEPAKPLGIPFWIWAVIAIYVALMTAIIALVMVKPSYVRPRTTGSKLGPVTGSSGNPFARIGNAITMRIRRWQYLRKPKDTGGDDTSDASD